MQIKKLLGVRYVVPLREGGSLPAIVETEDGGLWVTKFRGAGQGSRVLVAEIIAGLLARVLELPVPDVAVIFLHEGFGRTERDPEIQDLLKASTGMNVGLEFMEGALNFNPAADQSLIDPDLAAKIVWFDAFTTNVDRTVRNPNMMVWENRIVLIDNGTAFYFHHDWESLDEARTISSFAAIKHHVLLPFAGDLDRVNDQFTKTLSNGIFDRILQTVPDELLMHVPEGQRPVFPTPEAHRKAYVSYFQRRLISSTTFTEEAKQAREMVLSQPTQKLRYRR